MTTTRSVFHNLSSRGAHRAVPSHSRIRRGAMTLAATGVAFITLAAFTADSAVAATAAVGLGSASSYAVLAGTTITNTGASVISGDIGLSPGTSITGFPPGVQSSGVTHVADATALAAQTSLTAAYLDAAARTPFTVVSADLGGSTLAPGVYQAATSMSLTGTVTLNGGGDANAVFIFQAGSTLTAAASSHVALTNGAQACNVFWQVGSSATLGTTSSFAGTIMALSSATLDTGASLSGRVLARNGAVTLDDNAITAAACSAATSTTTSTTSTTTSTTVAVTTTAPPTTVASASTTTIAPIPTGSPGTGDGGIATRATSPLWTLGVGALGLAGLLGAWTLRPARARSGRRRP